MNCDWCTSEATQGGKAKAGTVGRTELYACETHKAVIEKLNYVPMTESEFRKAVKKAAQGAK